MAVNQSKYRCPLCGGSLVWSLTNFRVGSSSEIICSNNSSSSRIDWKPRGDIFCRWKGKVVRKLDGSVAFYKEDGVSLLKSFSSN